MKKIFLLTITALAIVSCQKIRDDLLPASNTRMYCQSILTPDSLVKVFVGRTTSIGTSEGSCINDATVLLYKNDTICDTLLRIANGVYLSDSKPSIGNNYYLEILKETKLSASVIVPDTAKLIGATFEYPTGYDAKNQQTYGDLEITIQDEPDVDNYYELIIFTKFYNDITKSFSYRFYNSYSITILGQVLQNEGDHEYNPSTLFFSDQLFNGQKGNISFSVATGSTCTNNDCFSDLELNGYILIRSISKEYYLYRKMYARHAYNSNIHSEGINNILFMGEPIDMYSNVNGGLGVVAAYSSTIRKINGK